MTGQLWSEQKEDVYGCLESPRAYDGVPDELSKDELRAAAQENQWPYRPAQGAILLWVYMPCGIPGAKLRRASFEGVVLAVLPAVPPRGISMEPVVAGQDKGKGPMYLLLGHRELVGTCAWPGGCQRKRRD